MSKLAHELNTTFNLKKCEVVSNINREEIIEFFKNLKVAMFLNVYFNNPTEEDVDNRLNLSFNHFKKACENTKIDTDKVLKELEPKIVEIKQSLLLDINAIYMGDPACNSCSEIIITYPGFLAIAAYRIAHEFYKMNLKPVARIISEYAHSRTGIDINPGAQIGKNFFIDHGTGIVIGETCIIEDNVKIYQGVTLGALSLKEGRKLSNVKRHPTIESNVTIYSNVSIFGGDTVIGHNSTIGSGSQIISSIPPYSLVRAKPVDIQIIKNKQNWKK